MTTDYRCLNCHQLLFRGSLKLLLSKKTTDEAFIEVKCERFGKLNRFAYNLADEVRKDDLPSEPLFDEVPT